MNKRGYFLAFAIILLLGLPLVLPLPLDVHCNTSGYERGLYMAECHDSDFGTYEHGAFYYGLIDLTALRQAQVLFVGNSRTQFAFSTQAVNDYFKRNGIAFYVLGFGYAEGSPFADLLIKKYGLRPRVIVANADPFFIPDLSVAAKEVVNGNLVTYLRYRLKQAFQLVHPILASLRRRLLGETPPHPTLFRSETNGFWDWQRTWFKSYPSLPIPWDTLPHLSEDTRAQALTVASHFLSGMPVHPQCMVLTVVPNGMTNGEDTAEAVARKFHLPLIVPEIRDLSTIDKSHLSKESAERWSRRLMQQLTPILHRCLGQEVIAMGKIASEATP